MKNHHNRCLIVDFDLGLSMSLSHTPARAHTRAGVLLSFNSYLGSQCRFGLNIFYSEISTEIAHCTHSNKDQNESKYLLSSSPRRINW